MSRHKFNTDRMNNASLEAVAQLAIGLVGQLQDAPKELQPLGLAIAFITLCEHFGIEPAETFRASTNMRATRMMDSKGYRAFQLYVENEL